MRLTVGIVTHDSEQYAARCLEMLVAQRDLGTLGKDWQIVCLDNASRNRIELARLEQKFRQVLFRKEGLNLGFGPGHNRIMELFPAAFHAVMNPDVLCGETFLSVLVQALEANPFYGSATGKLLQWVPGGTPEKTRVIDSVGLGATKSHAFFDRGQGKEDRGQYDLPRECFGGTGAATVYRHSALEEVAYRSAEGMEFFDATMFLYKEDVDLAYRLLAAAHPCLYLPVAVAWHARGLGKRHARRRRSRSQRVWSAAHQSLLLRKHRGWWPMSIRLRTALRETVRWTALLSGEPAVFFRARALLRALRPEAAKRMLTVKHAIAFTECAHLFSA